jgi:dipeptidyl aminopeptidase/acylaminoacyl peptidase
VGGSDGARGKRQIAWRKDDKGLSFLEAEPALDTAARADGAQQGGDEAQPSRRKDRVMLWAPPFDSASLSVVYENPGPIQSHQYSSDDRWLFLTERQGRSTRLSAVDLTEPATKHTLARWATDDVYRNPGSLVLTGGGLPATGRRFFGRRSGGGETVQLSADGSSAFFYGVAYDREPVANGPRAFLDRVAIATGEKTRLWEGSNAGVWEHLTAVLDIDASRFVVEREGPTRVAQSYVLHDDSVGTRLTRNKDYLPEVTSAKRERFVVERPDGFRFLVNVVLPRGYAGGRLPAMFWFYPREYESQKSYDEAGRTYNKNAFPRLNPRSMDYLVLLGYAVVEPDAPIVGKAGQMNDSYANDLRNNLSTVIDSLDARGIIDRARLGIGGHSYGAFSTANAMVHTPFFKAGIAGDGNYNRTLTPLALQNEHRFFWDARDVYLEMSPFMYANQLTGALLMYHGLHDQNVGTDPINTPRMFHALNGLGKTAAMYLYPYEDHGPAARETLLDLWARWTAWLDVYLRGAGEGAK